MPDYKLIEGNSYTFTILRVIEMPPDGEEHYVVQSESGSKHLLPKQFYKHYDLKTGQSIRCKVDKINCSGALFLEPEHPGCRPGDILSFSVIGNKTLINSFGEEETLLLLNDPWNMGTYLNAGDQGELAKSPVLQCRVERIKKGQLLVSYPGVYQPGELPEGNVMPAFRITGMITLAEGLEYYVLQLDGSNHYLRTKYYTNYGFLPGSTIKCRILGKPVLYYHYLEPKHPYYAPGEEHWFEYVRIDAADSLTAEHESNIVVKDLLGHEYTLPFNGPEPQWPTRVKAKIKEIRMSKCVLDFIAVE